VERVRIGLVGLGTVGGSFYELLAGNAEEIGRRLGVAIEVPVVAVRDPSRPRRVGANTRVVGDHREILDDPSLHVVVELVGGTDVAREVVRGALERGKHVITANKALLAAHGEELFALARSKGVELLFEASVCGGIPIVKVLRESLLGNRISRILGIVNGTTNYILTRMGEEGIGYAEALAEAQEKGFAEVDPAADVGGADAAQKISLLASLAFGSWVDWREVLCEGITKVTPRDIAFARSAGYVFKPVAGAALVEGRPLVTVYPAMVSADHPLAAVRGEYNGVMVDSDFLGPSVYQGRGAGGRPTASSLASDLGDLARILVAGPAARPRMPAFERRGLFPAERLRCRCCFHFVTANRPGIWALVTGTLADNGINIESVHQKWEDRTLPSDLFVLVDEAEEGQLRRALAEVAAAPGISAESRYFRIVDGETGTGGRA
jgi:homoserine dehydrogenase